MIFSSCLLAGELDNASIPSLKVITTKLEFGNVTIGEEKVLEIEIRNNSIRVFKSAIIYGFTIAPDYKDFFMLDTVDDFHQVSLRESDQKSFRVKFKPSSIREYNSVVYIKSNAYGAEPIFLIGRATDGNQSSVQEITEIESLSFQSIDERNSITFSIVSESVFEDGTFAIYSQEGKLIKSIVVSGNSSEFTVSISKSELPLLSLIRFTQGEKTYVHKHLRE